MYSPWGMTTTSETVRKNVEYLLKTRGLSGSALARGVGRSSSWASNFLSGKKSIPLNCVAEIAEFLQVTPEDLTRRPPNGTVTDVPNGNGGLDNPPKGGNNLPPPGPSSAGEKESPMLKQDAATVAALFQLLPDDQKDEMFAQLQQRVARLLTRGAVKTLAVL